MKRLLVMLLLLLVVFGGYYYLRLNQAGSRSARRVVTPQFNIKDSPLEVNNFAKVLGATTSQVLKSGQNLLNQATDGQAEPIINKTLNNLQQQVQDLPKEQYQKVKYEFCQDVIQNDSINQQDSSQNQDSSLE